MNVADALAEAGVEPAVAERLAAYAEALLSANRRFNLSGADTVEALLPHLLDSLTLAPYVNGPLVDVGSGGGLPAIPLAIATGQTVTAIEATAKKAAFLRGVAADLALDVRVVTGRAETAAHDPDLREQFVAATARAVSSAPTVAELTAPFLAIGGSALLQRGALDVRERDAVSDAAPMLGCVLEREIPLDGDRRIVVLRKIAATPTRFPRRVGIPEKRPLCW